MNRIQEKCQPRYDAGYDEDWLVGPAVGFWRPLTLNDCSFGIGHVEKTNDRDYEIEER